MSMRPPIHSAGLLGQAAVTALTLALCACGGGGGGGSGIASTPAPPVPAPPTISAPAAASQGPAAAPVVASADGPSFTAGPAPGTQFPLLQTVMIYDSRGARADATVNAAGGTATIEESIARFDVAGFRIAPVDWGWIDHPGLDWTRLGYWATVGGFGGDATIVRNAAFVTGYETSAAGMPASGTATYSGGINGIVIFPGIDPATGCGCTNLPLMGNATLTANFGERKVSGTMTIWAGPFWEPVEGERWNDVAFTSSLTGNRFSGTTSVTSAPGGTASLAANATGTIEGKFFGPSAQEAGAVWTLFDGTRAAIGTLSGKR